MRKTIFITLFLAFTETLLAQKGLEIVIPYDSSSESYLYKGIVADLNLNKADIYKKTKKWSKDNFLNSDFQLDDINEKIVDKESFQVSTVVNLGMGMNQSVPYDVDYNLEIDFKDSKYRYCIKNIYVGKILLNDFINQAVIAKAGRKKIVKHINETCQEVHNEFMKLIDSLEAYIKSDNKSSDW